MEFKNLASHRTDIIIENFYEKIAEDLSSAQILSRNLVTSSDKPNWPFVYVDEFDWRCEASLSASLADSIAVLPIVEEPNREIWEEFLRSRYSIPKSADHIIQDIEYRQSKRQIEDGIYDFTREGAINANTRNMYFPIAQISPSILDPTEDLIGTLFNELSSSQRSRGLNESLFRGGAVFSPFLFKDSGGWDYVNLTSPRFSMYYPVWSGSSIMAMLDFQIDWSNLIRPDFDNDRESLSIVATDNCGTMFTFEVVNDRVLFVGEGDHHDESFFEENLILEFRNTSASIYQALFSIHGDLPLQEHMCQFSFTVYPTESFEGYHKSSRPQIYRGIVLGVFVLIIAIFIVYDMYVEQRQTRIVEVAEQSDAIVRSLFPTQVRSRLYEQAKQRQEERRQQKEYDLSPRKRLKHLIGLSSEELCIEDVHQVEEEQIAELYPEASVMFADLAGFTAWSSEREPAQVFKLLETIYKDMDLLAKKMNVFKVETVGDCYVAATGIPDKQEDHAEILVQFARRCILRVNEVTKNLEASLGPGTGDLSMRVGIHSGPVTAGVLRGQKARFQLFGDTMNMTARVESSGLPNRIHISSATAQILIKNGKSSWIIERPDSVVLKGKGAVKTYWIHLKSLTSSSASSASSDKGYGNIGTNNDTLNMNIARIAHDCGLQAILGATRIGNHFSRLIDWNTKVVEGFLCEVIAHRSTDRGGFHSLLTQSLSKTPIEELQYSIKVQKLDGGARKTLELSTEVRSELSLYVAVIASGYRDNPFHNFEHAAHVMLSASKLIKRIKNPDIDFMHTELDADHIHTFTYGIGNDPMIHLAVIFSALVHDVGHPGISNGQLGKEEPQLARKYMNRCVAEQQSIDVAWNLLMHPSFSNLRAAMWQSEADAARFRQLLVNSVIATDIFDKELKDTRNCRWIRAFSEAGAHSEEEKMDYRATVVIEHIIQASDVSHTMQHWHVYQKWNEKLFNEMYTAFVQDRGFDPVPGWYEGELGFFDNYVIPLARKLQECGVFGVSGDEYLGYALRNREEWEQKGQAVVEKLKERYRAKHLMSSRNLRQSISLDEAPTDNADDEKPLISVQSYDLDLSQSNFIKVVVPPGRVGITVQSVRDEKKIVEIEEDSPISNCISEGDTLVSIDNIKLNGYSEEATIALLESSSQYERTLTVKKS